jgi:drug/metabolite transporter (DMT)-like permease
VTVVQLLVAGALSLACMPVAGERLPALAILGAGLIVAGTLVSESRPRRPREADADAT